MQALGPAVLHLGLGLVLLNMGELGGWVQVAAALTAGSRGACWKRAGGGGGSPGAAAVRWRGTAPAPLTSAPGPSIHPPAAVRPEPAPGSVAEGARAAVQTCAGFLAAWSSACWFAYGAGLLFFYRTGMLQP